MDESSTHFAGLQDIPSLKAEGILPRRRRKQVEGIQIATDEGNSVEE